MLFGQENYEQAPLEAAQFGEHLKFGEHSAQAPLDLLEALWLAGEMDGLTPVWKEGMPDYVPVSQVYPARRLP